MLIPIYVLIGVWGGPRRLRATATFVIYTMAGSLLMLASIIAFGLSQDTFSLVDSGVSTNDWVFLGFLVAFAVKAPIFPFHGWLVDAYREAPPEVAAILSGVVSKAAVYGLLRIVIAKFPEPVDQFQSTILAFATIGLIYASLLAFRAPDIRSVTAYSSMAQMGLVTMGLFSLNELGVNGAILQSVAHGLVSATLFLLAGMVEMRTGTSAFAGLGGMARGRPVLATLLMTTGIIALAVPGSVAFAGEFLILAGVYGVAWGWAVAGAAGIVLAAMYMLRLISAVLHAARGRDVREDAPDVRPFELAIVDPARRAAALPLRLAGARLGARPSRWSTTRSRRRRCRDPDSEGRLARAGADAGAARRLGRRSARQRARALVDAPVLLRARRLRRLHHVRRLRRDRLRRHDAGRRADRRVVHPRPAGCVLGADHRRGRHPGRARLLGRRAARPRRRVLRPPRGGRRRAWSSSSPRRT